MMGSSMEQLSEEFVRFSNGGIKFLRSFVRDEDLSTPRYREEDIERLSRGIVRLRETAKGYYAVPKLDEAIQLFISPQGSAMRVQNNVLVRNSVDEVYRLLRGTVDACLALRPDGVTLDELIILGDEASSEAQSLKTVTEIGAAAVGPYVRKPKQSQVTPIEPVIQKKQEDYNSDEPEAWRIDAACRGIATPDIFFPDKGTNKVAVRMCHACLVSQFCLKYALDNNEKSGIWGGLTANERKNMQTSRNRRP